MPHRPPATPTHPPGCPPSRRHCPSIASALCHRLRSWSALELDPTRRLGMAAFQRRFGLTPRPPEADLVGATWLARTPEPWTVSGHIAYDVTHTVFHLTDWGENPDALPQDIADDLATWL